MTVQELGQGKKGFEHSHKDIIDRHDADELKLP